MIERSDINNLVATRASWGAVFAGFVTVVAVQITLSLLGMGIGLGALGMRGAAMAQEVGIGSVIWMGITSIVAFFMGGWVAGKLSAVQLRSSASLHGILVWGLTSLVALFLLTSAIGAVLGGTFGMLTNMAGTMISQVPQQQKSQMIQQGQQQMGKNQQGPQASTKAGMGGVPTMPNEVGSMLNKMATQGPQSITPQDRESAVNALAGTGNMSRDQAEQAVNRMISTAQAAQQQAGAAAKAAGVTGISGFVLMVLTALVSAWGAAAGRVKTPVQA